MIHEIQGDALVACKGNILCHQTNYFGVMGAGIAAQIKKKLLNPSLFKEYYDLCQKRERSLLGSVQMLETLDGTIVANCFSQDDGNNAYPTGRISPFTDYWAVKSCFQTVKNNAEVYKKNVYIPYKYGCGIAGGNWNQVCTIINDVFKDATVDVFIVRRPQD